MPEQETLQMTNILEHLENAAGRSGDEIKITDQNGSCSYRTLMENSKAAGSFLAKRLKKNSPAAVYMDKSIHALEAFFGIVYAGGFYVMINTRNPDKRILQILDVCENCLIITDREHYDKCRSFGNGSEVILIEEIIKTEPDETILNEIREASGPDDPLYSLFTSGSTGVPKGVLISHRCVIDFIDYFPDIFGITENDIIGNQAPFDFDVSVKDIFSALKTGAKLVIIPTSAFTLPNQVLDVICEEKVTVLIWAVSALCLISMMKGFDYKVPESVRLVMFSGEVMPPSQLRIWKQNLKKAEFVNLYGPTEITCNSTFYRIKQDEEIPDIIPMGKPFPGRKVFLLDSNDKEITGTGITGEICTGGTSLALGYYRNKEATDKAFTTAPLCEGYTGRIYRTGDLAYYNDDRDLIFSGRKDFQIKHMGHRIELEEIERALENISGVDRMICLYDNIKKKIHAFYAGEKGKKEIRIEASVLLPPYMIPSKWHSLETIPLTKNGKADRTALANTIKEQNK